MQNLTPDDDFAFEAAPGLPGKLPRGESILWQGRPNALALARQSLWLNWVIGYFALLVVWRFGVSSTTVPLAEAAGHAVPFLVLGVLVTGLIWLIAWFQARGAVYTLTTHRVVMRIGAALQLTLNLPYSRIQNANLQLKGGVGTIALEIEEDSKISYVMAWPHVRPWHMKQPQPALRCIPDAANVAKILADAARTQVSDAPSIKVAKAEQSAPAAVPAE